MSTVAVEDRRSTALSVTELASRIQGTLEADFGEVWIVGEISGLRAPASGHLYFTLKDDTSQLRGVMFRGYARLLRFPPEDGLAVLIKGRVSLYSARGDLQVYAATMEPRGLGEQQLALEQLKAKLAAEGLFAAERKRPLPFFPRSIGVVTALGGAALYDILTILHGRCPYTRVVVRPTQVQGAAAGVEIAAGIHDLNEHGQAEVIIVGRGGGSREDLHAFNEEVVARAIADSSLPVIAAVGHEIDLSIADLAADHRAPTPTAAAEIVVPVWTDLSSQIAGNARALASTMQRYIGDSHGRVDRFAERIRDPQHQIDVLREQLRISVSRLCTAFQRKNEYARAQVQDLAATLNSLSPLAVLGRGYSLTRTVPGNTLVTTAANLTRGDQVRLTFAHGEATARIEEVVK